MKSGENDTEWIELTPRRRAKLAAERNRTALGAKAIFDKIIDPPPSLTIGMVYGWFRTQKKARRHLFELVLQAYASELTLVCASQPDQQGWIYPKELTYRRKKGDEAKRSKAKTRIKISNAMRSKLSDELSRTGVSPTRLPSILTKLESPLGPSSVVLWRNGGVKSAPIGQWRSVMAFLESRPDAKRPKIIMRQSYDLPSHCDLYPEDILPALPWKPLNERSLVLINSRTQNEVICETRYNTLHSERKRTLVSPKRLLELSDNLPVGLKVILIQNWFRQVTRSAKSRYINWVLDAYSKLPNATP